VQEKRGISGSSFPSLRCCIRCVECYFFSFWSVLGYASESPDLFACWWTAGRPGSAVIWKMVPTCILWCVWKERNDRCFEDLERSLEDILASFFHTLYLWTVAFVSPLSFTFDEFLVRFSLSS
jgi:hypothetical protein